LELCPKPHILFCLDTKKYAKKIKATPASFEKLRWVAKKSELAPPASRRFEQQIFLHATCPCFSSHRPMPTGEGNCTILNYIKDIPLNQVFTKYLIQSSQFFA
jgi:hypothetical protein